ncbi:MAG: hypothetical protein JGK30_07745 [Microcoleus sp. PH2017_40_RAT_O_B]|uniref:hypothetical protein n=1 Tax=unclassified Microcoleus TaxID=2642155 RepID=UPI001E0DAED2|nr:MULTISPECIES: hypothetical protein [unclassified Microcoleus]MCC3572191.1 hypothetical protein [Microcoleus sp. PH2017_34_RAT_O_A]MCC3609394.1 hypothetical protein [Microcoleus sp. PH2017_40_RAT_O_B]
MAIPSVVQGQGTIKTEDGKVIELDSPKGSTWLESIGSFRFEPVGANKPYTVRKESNKGGDYWYGYRKMSGKLHKKYIGKTSELSTAKLEEVAEALNTFPQPRVTDKVTDTSNQGVAYTVTDNRDADRLTALELQVKALQESEALRSGLPRKFESGNFEELPTATDNELQTAIGNLQVTLLRLELENQSLNEELAAARETIATQGLLVRDGADCEWKLKQDLEGAKADYAKLLESSSHIKADREKQITELRSQVATERADREEVETQLTDLKQNSATASKDLPDAADLLNQLKAKWKKSETKRKEPKADLADLDFVLEILEG